MADQIDSGPLLASVRAALASGLPCTMGPKPKPVEERFWAQVRKSEGCWEWTGALHRGGYGAIGVPTDGPNYRSVPAHRMSWELANGPIPAGLHCLHRCDNRKCVRPDHLFLGTHQENMADRDRKGRNASGDRNGRRLHPERYANASNARHHIPRGEENKSAKLTEVQVREIRARFIPRVVTRAMLAREYGVGVTAIKNIVAGRTWTHVGGTK